MYTNRWILALLLVPFTHAGAAGELPEVPGSIDRQTHYLYLAQVYYPPEALRPDRVAEIIAMAVPKATDLALKPVALTPAQRAQDRYPNAPAHEFDFQTNPDDPIPIALVFLTEPEVKPGRRIPDSGSQFMALLGLGRSYYMERTQIKVLIYEKGGRVTIGCRTFERLGDDAPWKPGLGTQPGGPSASVFAQNAAKQVRRALQNEFSQWVRPGAAAIAAGH